MSNSRNQDLISSLRVLTSTIDNLTAVEKALSNLGLEGDAKMARELHQSLDYSVIQVLQELDLVKFKRHNNR